MCTKCPALFMLNYAVLRQSIMLHDKPFVISFIYMFYKVVNVRHTNGLLLP